MTGFFVGLNVGVIEKRFAILNSGESVADVGFAGPNGFYFAAFQLDAGFAAIEDVKIAQRLAIKDRLSGHDRARSALGNYALSGPLRGSNASLPAGSFLRTVLCCEKRGVVSTIAPAPQPGLPHRLR